MLCSGAALLTFLQFEKRIGHIAQTGKSCFYCSPFNNLLLVFQKGQIFGVLSTESPTWTVNKNYKLYSFASLRRLSRTAMSCYAAVPFSFHFEMMDWTDVRNAFPYQIYPPASRSWSQTWMSHLGWVLKNKTFILDLQIFTDICFLLLNLHLPIFQL